VSDAMWMLVWYLLIGIAFATFVMGLASGKATKQMSLFTVGEWISLLSRLILLIVTWPVAIIFAIGKAIGAVATKDEEQ